VHNFKTLLKVLFSGGVFSVYTTVKQAKETPIHCNTRIVIFSYLIIHILWGLKGCALNCNDIVIQNVLFDYKYTFKLIEQMIRFYQTKYKMKYVRPSDNLYRCFIFIIYIIK